MKKGLLSRAFAMADSLYFTAGFYFARALSDSTFLDLNAQAHHSRLYRGVDAVWSRVKGPLQNSFMNKMMDTVTKNDFAPRPTNDVLKKAAMPLLRIVPQLLPRLLAHPTTGVALAATALVILDPHVRSMVTDQVAQLMAMFNTQNSDVTQTLAARQEPAAVMSGVQPSIS